MIDQPQAGPDLDARIYTEVFGEEIRRSHIPPFSTTWDGAGLVLARMRELGWAVHLTDWATIADEPDDPISGAVAVFTRERDGRLLRGRTNGLDVLTPAGICLAALAAVAREDEP